MKINILGTEYDYNITTSKEDIALCDINGYCDAFAKKIAVESDYNEKNPNSIKDFDSFAKTTKRHEIIHAYLHESGLREFAENEQLVDWIAWQFPKMTKSFEEVGAN